MDKEQRNRLFNFTKETYEGSFKPDLLEQYKLYVQSVDNVSARRIGSSRYLLTVNAALIALYGFQSANTGQIFLMVLVAIAGIVVSLLSYNIIKSHSDLNAVKFKVIDELEQQLPAAPNDYEWQLPKEGDSKVYRSVSQIEFRIPTVFPFLILVARSVWISVFRRKSCTRVAYMF